MYQALLIFCSIIFFIYGFGVSVLIQNFINNRSHLIGFTRSLFPLTGIMIYLITDLFFCYIVQIFFIDNYLILFISNFIFNFVILLFLFIDFLVSNKTKWSSLIVTQRKWYTYFFGFFCVVILYCIYIFIHSVYQRNSASIWEIKSVGMLYMTSFFHIILPANEINKLSVLSIYVYPFFIIAFTFYVIKHFYYLFLNKQLSNSCLFILLLILISVSCFLLISFSFINLVFIVCSLVLLNHTRQNHLFSYRKILLSSGFLLLTYFIGSALSLYIWLVIAFAYLLLQIMTSSREIIAGVILFCVLGVVPFSYEISKALINSSVLFSTSAKILWICLLVLLLLLTYCIFSRSGTIRMINYMLNINKGFSVISVIVLTCLFAFSTSQSFAINNCIILWKSNVNFLNNYFSILSRPKYDWLQFCANLIFFLTIPILTPAWLLKYWFVPDKKSDWKYPMILYIIFIFVCFNPLAMTTWSILLSQLLPRQSINNLIGILWMALIINFVTQTFLVNTDRLLNNANNKKKQIHSELSCWLVVKPKLTRKYGLSTYENR